MRLKSDKLQDYLEDYLVDPTDADTDDYDGPLSKERYSIDPADYIQSVILGLGTSGQTRSCLRSVRTGLLFLLEREKFKWDDSCTVERLLEFDKRRKPVVFGSTGMADFFIHWAEERNLIDCMNDHPGRSSDLDMNLLTRVLNTEYLIALIDQVLALEDEPGSDQATENTTTTDQLKCEGMRGHKRGEMVVIGVVKPK